MKCFLSPRVTSVRKLVLEPTEWTSATSPTALGTSTTCPHCGHLREPCGHSQGVEDEGIVTQRRRTAPPDVRATVATGEPHSQTTTATIGHRMPTRRPWTVRLETPRMGYYRKWNRVEGRKRYDWWFPFAYKGKGWRKRRAEFLVWVG
jgi:hypothetical protein